MSEKKPGGAKAKGEIAIKLEWVGEEEVPMLYAGNIFVRHTDDVFQVTFGQTHGPYLVDPSREELESIKSVPVQIVARLAIPPARMKEFVKVLSDNYDNFVKTRGGE